MGDNPRQLATIAGFTLDLYEPGNGLRYSAYGDVSHLNRTRRWRWIGAQKPLRRHVPEA